MSSRKAQFWKISRWFILLFIVMFVFRFIYGYVAQQTVGGNDYFSDFFDSLSEVRKNYASEKKMSSAVYSPQPQSQASNQKFEKSGIVQSKSAVFDSDEKKVRNEVAKCSALIQYEQSLGLKGSRELHLMIGVSPDQFDSLYNNVRSIGNIRRMQITKVDKTNEYRKLNAEKASLEATLTSLKELKSKGGVISDYILLHDKILSTESQLQNLGVELGNFDTENEFCTVKFSLYESSDSKISTMHRVKVALEWTIKYYVMILFGMFLTAVSVFILIKIYEQLTKFMNKA